jgi:hypothetical protein
MKVCEKNKMSIADFRVMQDFLFEAINPSILAKFNALSQATIHLIILIYLDDFN